MKPLRKMFSSMKSLDSIGESYHFYAKKYELKEKKATPHKFKVSALNEEIALVIVRRQIR